MRYRRSSGRGRRLGFVVLALSGVGGAQVDCSNPDNLCTGDPCVIPVIEPANPCTLDFGARELVIEGLRNVESVDFSALKITVAGPVRGRRDMGGSLALTASGELALDGPIEFAGGNITGPEETVSIEAPIKSTGRANGGRCGAITIHAGKAVPIVDAAIVCAGRVGGDGISIIGGGIQVNSTLKTVSKDAADGDIELDADGPGSFGGNVIVTGEILARGSRPGDVIATGQTVTFEDATVSSSSRLGGGAQRYTASAGNVALQGDFVASKGGTIQATATGDVITDGDFGVGAGGCIGLSAGGVVTTGSSVFDQTVVTTCP